MDTQSSGEQLDTDSDSFEVHMCTADSSQEEDYSTEGSSKPFEDQTRGLEGNISLAEEKKNLDVDTQLKSKLQEQNSKSGAVLSEADNEPLRPSLAKYNPKRLSKETFERDF